MIDEKPILHIIDFRLKKVREHLKSLVDNSNLEPDIKEQLMLIGGDLTEPMLIELKDAIEKQAWKMKAKKSDKRDDALTTNECLEIYDKYFSKNSFATALTMVNLLYMIVFEEFMNSGLKGSLDRKHIKHLMSLPQKDILKILTRKKANA